MNKKEFTKSCQLLTNKEEFEQLKGTIKSLEYHLQNNFLSGLKLGVKHSLLEKFATDTFELEKRTAWQFGDFYQQYCIHEALHEAYKMDIVTNSLYTACTQGTFLASQISKVELSDKESAIFAHLMKPRTPQEKLREANERFISEFRIAFRIPQFEEWLTKQLIKFESFLNRIKNK